MGANQIDSIHDTSGAVTTYDLPADILSRYPILGTLTLDSTKQTAVALYNLNRMVASGIEALQCGRTIRGLTSTTWLQRLIDQIEGLMDQLQQAPDGALVSSFVAAEATLFTSLQTQWRALASPSPFQVDDL